MAAYEIPRSYEFVEGFPMTVPGKLQTFKLREQAVKELGLEAADAIETA